MATLSDYVSGTISLTNGSVDFTGAATGWLLAAFKEGDTIIDITGATEFMGVVAEITSNTAGKLTKEWEGPDLVDAPYRMRYQADGSRVSAQARNLIELLGDGTLTSLAGLSGPGVIELLPGGGAQVVPKTDLVSGANYDVQVDDLAARAVYDGQAAGFSVLVSDVGDGRSAIYSKASNTSADWTDPAYVTGPLGETPDVTIGTVTTGAPGTDAEVTATPVTGGVELDFTIPAGEGFVFEGAYDGGTGYALGDVVRDAGSSWIALQATTGNAPPTLPTTSNAYWELLAQKGADGAGIVSSIVAGANVSVDNTNPANPIVSSDVGLPKATVAAIANINLAAPGASIDSRAMVLGDTFLATAQSAPAANGLYVWNGATVAATRASVANSFDKIAGQYFSVMEGTVNSDTLWRCTSNLGGTLGTTALVFEKFVSSGGGGISVPGLRLTLTSGVAVMSSSVAGATTVYATPVGGGYVPLYDGAALTMAKFAEVSQATTDTTKSPAAVAANKVYDLFAWDDGGTKRVTRGPAWTSDTVRGYNFTNVDGILVNASAITNGPAAERGTWIGTIASNAAGTIDYILGAAASGGVAASLMVANAYNRVQVATTVKDNGANYTYSSATIRQARASTGNQINFVQAGAEFGIGVAYATNNVSAAAASAVPVVGLGFDTKTALSLPFACVQNSPSATAITSASALPGVWSAGIGRHYIAGLEYSGTAVADTFNSQSNNALMATIWL